MPVPCSFWTPGLVLGSRPMLYRASRKVGWALCPVSLLCVGFIKIALVVCWRLWLRKMQQPPASSTGPPPVYRNEARAQAVPWGDHRPARSSKTVVPSTP